MNRIVLTPKDPLLSFDYQSVLFRQFIKNSIVGMEVNAGEEIELTILGGTAAFQVISVEPPNGESITAQTDVVMQVPASMVLEK